MANLPLNDRISQESERKLNQRIITSNYGDGFQQRAAIGLNSRFDEWNLVWNNLSLVNVNILLNFFESHGMVNSWEWTPLNGTQGKYVFSSAPIQSNVGIYYSFSVTVRQVFEA